LQQIPLLAAVAGQNNISIIIKMVVVFAMILTLVIPLTSMARPDVLVIDVRGVSSIGADNLISPFMHI
jgi:hypothetical protein